MSTNLQFALSVRQPWPYAIFHMGKDVENRTWPPPAHAIGTRIWIHASKTADPIEPEDLLPLLAPEDPDLPRLRDLPLGVIVGSVRVTGFRNTSQGSRWWHGPLGWGLVDPRPLDTPVPCRGHLGLWRVPVAVLAQLPYAHGKETHPCPR